MRAFTTRLACTQPSLCLLCSQVLFSARRLNGPTTGVPPPASPEAAGISTPVGRAQADKFFARQQVRSRRQTLEFVPFCHILCHGSWLV